MSSLFTVWITTEGLDLSPLLCTPGDKANDLAYELVSRRVATDVVLMPCCRLDGYACPRDQYDPAELDRPTEILRAAAEHHGIAWPDDVELDR